MNTPDYKNTALTWFDQNPATYLTDYLFCFSQLTIVVYLRYKVNKIPSENNPNYDQQKTLLWFVAAYNLWLGLGFGIGGLHHNLYDMTKGRVLSNRIYWKIAVFSAAMSIPFAIIVPVLQVVFIETKKLKIIKLVVVVVAILYALQCVP